MLTVMFAAVQASHYAKQSELFVLPECLYGKYTPCEEVRIIYTLSLIF